MSVNNQYIYFSDSSDSRLCGNDIEPSFPRRRESPTFNRKKRISIGLSLVFTFISCIYLYTRFNPEDNRFFPKCPIHLLTGYLCPGCGSQRAFYHLLQGNITTAFKYNPLALLIVPYILTGIYIEYVANKTNPRIANIRKLLFGKWAAIILGLILIVYTIVRNQASTFFLALSAINVS